MNEMMTVLAMAVTVEALVEYGKSVGTAATGSGWKQAVTRLAAVAAGIILCLAADADLYAVLGFGFAWPWLGQVLTGVLVSRGANYVNDMAQKLTGTKEAK